MDEALIQQLVALGAIPEEQALLMRQMQQGEGMMGAPSAQGMRVGSTYVASSPMEHAAVALQRYLGQRQMAEAEKGYRGTLGEQTSGRSAAAEALRKLMMQQQAPPMDPMGQGPWAGGYGLGG